MPREPSPSCPIMGHVGQRAVLGQQSFLSGSAVPAWGLNRQDGRNAYISHLQWESQRNNLLPPVPRALKLNLPGSGGRVQKKMKKDVKPIDTYDGLSYFH